MEHWLYLSRVVKYCLDVSPEMLGLSRVGGAAPKFALLAPVEADIRQRLHSLSFCPVHHSICADLHHHFS